MKKNYLIIILFLLSGVLIYLNLSNLIKLKNKKIFCPQDVKLCSDGSYVSRIPPYCEFQMCPKEDLIVVENPRAREEISSPLFISGKARGYWFFEASFPIELVDENNNLIAQTIAQAKGEWMTEDFVPFEATLNFVNPKTNKGFLIFRKDNPSGLKEHYDELRVSIIFKNK